MNKNRTDMIGVRVGSLIVESFHGIDEKLQERLWLCRCDCGGTAIRRTWALRNDARKGTEPYCRRCKSERFLESAFIRERQDKTAQRIRETFEVHGTLYTAIDERRLEDDTREALEAEFGETPFVFAPPPVENWGAVEDALVELLDRAFATAPEGDPLQHARMCARASILGQGEERSAIRHRERRARRSREAA